MAKKNKKSVSVETVVLDVETVPAATIAPETPVVEAAKATTETPALAIGEGEIRFDVPPPKRGKVAEKLGPLFASPVGASQAFTFETHEKAVNFRLGAAVCAKKRGVKISASLLKDSKTVTIWRAEA